MIVGGEIASSDIFSSEVVNGQIAGSEIASSDSLSSDVVNGQIASSEIASSDSLSSDVVNGQIASSEIASSEIKSGVITSGMPRAGLPVEAVADELARLEPRLRDPQGVDFPVLVQLLEAIFASGGKRIRPALVFATARLGAGGSWDAGSTVDGAEPEVLMNLAAAVETLHAATLIHDDLVDGALLRRGQPTLNTHWSPGATVLAGDWLFARAARFAAATRNVDVVQIFARELGTLTDGELRQLFGRKAVPTMADYEYRIFAKTASLFEAATEGTAAILGADTATIAALADYGRELGMAFQIVDDILDYTSDEAKLGKPVGNDLRSGTVTLPAMNYLATHPDAAPWLAGAGPAPDGAVDGLVQAIRGHGPSIEAAWDAAQERVGRSCAALEAVPPSPARDDLARLARYAVERRS